MFKHRHVSHTILLVSVIGTLYTLCEVSTGVELHASNIHHCEHKMLHYTVVHVTGCRTSVWMNYGKVWPVYKAVISTKLLNRCRSNLVPTRKVVGKY
jgi:hypothetical protein